MGELWRVVKGVLGEWRRVFLLLFPQSIWVFCLVKNWDIVNLGTCLDGSAIEFGGVLG